MKKTLERSPSATAIHIVLSIKLGTIIVLENRAASVVRDQEQLIWVHRVIWKEVVLSKRTEVAHRNNEGKDTSPVILFRYVNRFSTTDWAPWSV